MFRKIMEGRKISGTVCLRGGRLSGGGEATATHSKLQRKTQRQKRDTTISST